MPFLDGFRPKPMPLGLQPKSGEIYGHLFENPATGLRQNVYWNARVGFEPVCIDGEEWVCSLAVEWLTWPIRHWRELDGMGLTKIGQRELVECSLYLFEEHHWAKLRHFELRETDAGIFEADFSAIADVNDGSGQRLFEASGRGGLAFLGIIVVSSNLKPESASELEVQAAASKFISLEDLTPPRSEGWRYVFDPIL